MSFHTDRQLTRNAPNACRLVLETVDELERLGGPTSATSTSAVAGSTRLARACSRLLLVLQCDVPITALAAVPDKSS